jgi:predicted acylesterase/phospholipase RssA
MKVALSLSGGGFRATLFHLGVISYLRRVGMLQQVAAVCGVSGGAIIGAHLVQNWERYTGSDEEFESTALDVIRLTQRDIRGRILRRLPWAMFLKPFGRLRVSRCSMFEHELSRFFSGDARLLRNAGPNHRRTRPELFVLATDLATGKDCSFNARGFARDTSKGEPMPTTALRTATAVATSASFPGFFPPYKVTAASLGISRDDWGPQPEIYLTDGGVFDNLGVRKLRSLRQRLNVDIEILSDAGATLEPRPEGFSGLVRTALRAVDILSNRVHELEYERVTPQEAAARDGSPPVERAEPSLRTPVLIPIKINHQVSADYAPGASIQAALQRVRTDLDRFSDTEVRWLIRHGGSVARQSIERRASLLTDVDVARGDQAPWDPMPALHPMREWPEPDDKAEERAWKRMESADRRRLGLLSLTDWVSWVNLVAFIIVIVVSSFVVSNVTTRAGFLSEAFPESYQVTFTYAKDSAREWAQEYHPELLDYVTRRTNKPPHGISKELASDASEYRNNASRTGYGRAFVRVIPPPNFKTRSDISEAERRDEVTKMRQNRDSLWKGILYYTFPSSTLTRATVFTLPGLGQLPAFFARSEEVDSTVVLQFQGHPIGGPAQDQQLCLDFVQDGRKFSRFSMKFQIEPGLAVGRPPIVPRDGTVLLPRSRTATADTSVTKSAELCGVKDDGFVLGVMRLE